MKIKKEICGKKTNAEWICVTRPHFRLKQVGKNNNQNQKLVPWKEQK